MTPSRVAAVLRQIADRVDRSKNPSKARVSSAVRDVLAGMDQPGVISFSGEVTSAHDGENSTVDGSIQLDGQEHKVSGNASGRDTEWTIDGEIASYGDPLAKQVGDYFDEMWGQWFPEMDSDFKATIQNCNLVSKVPLEPTPGV